MAQITKHYMTTNLNKTFLYNFTRPHVFQFPQEKVKERKILLKRVRFSQELYKVSFQSLHLTQFILKYIITPQSSPMGHEVDNSYINKYLLVCLNFYFYMKKKYKFTNQRMVLVSRQSTLFDKKEKKK